MTRTRSSFVAENRGSGAARRGRGAILIALTCLFLPWQSRAQTAVTGALAGTVTDRSGAVIVGAQILVTNEASGESRTVVTSNGGNYSVPLLLPAPYHVEVSKAGFKTVTVEHAKINVTETNTLNIRLEVGDVSEKVTVQGQTEQLQTESSTLGRVTTGEQVSTLPLVTRNYTEIIALNPGVASDVTNAGELGRGMVLGNGPNAIVSTVALAPTTIFR